MNRPTIVIGGKTYKAKIPKVRAWRDFMAFETGTGEIPAEEFLDRMAERIASVFDAPVTAKVIEDELPITRIRPLYQEIFQWIVSLVNQKMAEIPNGETGQAD